MTRKQADETSAIHSGRAKGLVGETVSPPIQRGSTVLIPSAADMYGTTVPTYGRAGLQPHAALREGLCTLEGASGCALFPSGLAALTGSILGLVESGDEVLVTDAIYAPTRRFCDKVLRKFGVSVAYFEPDATPEMLEARLTGRTRLIVLESPGSLTFEMQDIPAIAALAKRRGVITLMDNTWGAGHLFKPVSHGVDVSVQALTKYVSGHSDVFAGSACASDRAIVHKLEDAILHLGWSLAPDDAWLALRGLRTLPVRIARQGESALVVGAWLKGQPQVRGVICPGLPGDAGHGLWTRDCAGHNGLLCVILEPAPESAVHAFLDALEIFGLGYSWGGFESLAIHCDPQLKSRVHSRDYGGPLIRLHIGLEVADDLIADLRQALAAFDTALKQRGEAER